MVTVRIEGGGKRAKAKILIGGWGVIRKGDGGVRVGTEG